MVMSKKEYERMQELLENATRYEQMYKKEHEKLQNLKSFFKVSKRIAEIEENKDMIDIYNKMIMCIDS